MNASTLQRGVTLLAIVISTSAATRADFRTIDGSNNNMLHTTWGMANINLKRLSYAAYGGSGAWEMGGETRPNPRAVSNAVFAQSGSIKNNRNLTDWVWQWGQFIDHDLSHTLDNSGEFANIAVPAGDPWFDPYHTGAVELPFQRSAFDGDTGDSPGNPRQQVNSITSWIDASHVYGSDQGRADWLRTLDGGTLKVTTHATGDLLPFNDGTQSNAGGKGTNLFVAGDIRANEQTGLASAHTLFVREHNRLADLIGAADDSLSDDDIYQRARKIVGAQIQIITYREWLPALLGDGAVGSWGGYDESIDGGVAAEFSAAFFRVGHTMLSPEILRVDDNGDEIVFGHLSLRDAFFDPSRITDEGGIDPVLKGLASQRMQEIDAKVIDDVRNFLFGPPGAGGLDLASLNIQRGRDHGLPDYNTLRVMYGLASVTDFSQITSDATLAAALESVYGDVDNIDPWVGALSEDHAPGSSLGELLSAAFMDQFTRLRDGDRYWYENDATLTGILAGIGMTLDDLESMRLSDIILLNTNITNIQGNVFLIPAPGGAALLAMIGLGALRRRR